MDLHQMRNKETDDKKKAKGDGPVAPSFLSNIFTSLLVFLLLVSAYSLFTERKDKAAPVSLSTLATDMQNTDPNAPKVTEVDIQGTDLTILYSDGTKKESKKELESSLTDSLAPLVSGHRISVN